jgi:hypothetical protein
MGFRTVVVLQNDRAHEWQEDPQLGRKIWEASCDLFNPRDKGQNAGWFSYGMVAEQVHADVQTLAVIDGYSAKPVAHTHWNRGQTNEAVELALLKELAEKHGMSLRKKASKKVAA